DPVDRLEPLPALVGDHRDLRRQIGLAPLEDAPVLHVPDGLGRPQRRCWPTCVSTIAPISAAASAAVSRSISVARPGVPPRRISPMLRATCPPSRKPIGSRLNRLSRKPVYASAY